MSTESLKVLFNALISQVQSVTVHALTVVLAWWGGGINKDRASPRSAQITVWSGVRGWREWFA